MSISIGLSLAAGWEPAVSIDPGGLNGVNTLALEGCPTSLPGGELFFVSRRPGGCGVNSADIYLTRQHPVLGWVEPQHLGCELNSAGDEFAPSFVGAGGGLLFFSSNREGLHHSAFPESRPSLSRNGKRLIFGSGKPGGSGSSDICVTDR